MLALWKYRGLGYLPLLHAQGAARLALGQHSQVVASINPLHKYINFDWHQLHHNLLEIKEHFWSMRVVEWLVLAGLIGLARRSLTGVLLVGGWFAAFVVVKGTFAYADINDRSLFRIMMPSFPAFVLLLASLVYLLPGRRRRERRVRRSTHLRRRTRLGALAAAACFLALFPLALVALASPLHGPAPRAYEVDCLLRPSTRLSVSQRPWSAAASVCAGIPPSPREAASSTGSGAAARPTAERAARRFRMPSTTATSPWTTWERTRAARWVDRPGRGTWTYRLGLAANWLNSPDYGDVFTVGPPVTVRVP